MTTTISGAGAHGSAANARIPASVGGEKGYVTAEQIAALAGGGGGGSGDMSASTYDPQNIAGDTFARANHTGSQAISTITGLQSALDGKASSSHTHSISDTTGLQSALDGKASSSHSHNVSALSDASANARSLLQAADYAAMRTLLSLVVGTNVQEYNANLTTFAGIAPSANVQSVLGAADYAAIRTLLGLVIGTNVQAYDADTLKSDTTANLTVGYDGTAYDRGTVTTSTQTPTFAEGNVQRMVRNGAFTLNPPSSGDGHITIQVTNGESAGTLTTSGFTIANVDDLTNTNADDFLFHITKIGAFSRLHVEALQ